MVSPLSKFDFEVLNRTGVKHQGADALLRLATNKENTTLLMNDIPLLEIESRDPTATLANAADDIPTHLDQRPSISKLLRARLLDALCHMAQAQISPTNSELNVNTDDLLVWRLCNNET